VGPNRKASSASVWVHCNGWR